MIEPAESGPIDLLTGVDPFTKTAGVISSYADQRP